MTPAVRDGLVMLVRVCLWVAASAGAAVLIHFVASWVRRQWSAWRRREDQQLPKTLAEHKARQIAKANAAEIARANPLTIEQRRDRATEKKSA